jgi:endonuclease-3
MILLVNGGAATSIHPNAARFYRIGTMSRQIHGAVSSSKHISLKTQHPLSDSNSELAYGASGSETRVYTRKKRLKQEPFEPLEKYSGKGVNTHKVSFLN